MGGLVEAYSEVARRLGILAENEQTQGKGPVSGSSDDQPLILN